MKTNKSWCIIFLVSIFLINLLSIRCINNLNSNKNTDIDKHHLLPVLQICILIYGVLVCCGIAELDIEKVIIILIMNSFVNYLIMRQTTKLQLKILNFSVILITLFSIIMFNNEVLKSSSSKAKKRLSHSS